MSDVSGDWPAEVDDDGTGRTGTRVDTTWTGTVKTAINNQVLSATNPTLTPAEIIDEVVAARGSCADLDTRLDVEHNEDGTHKSTGILATFITETQYMGGLGGVNLCSNDDLLVWPDGDSSAPVLWNLVGSGATVARCGTACGDTTRKIGDLSAKVTRSGNNVTFSHILLQADAFTRADFLKQKHLAFGMWVKCSTPSVARICVSDNIGTTYSSYHTGGGSWEFLAATRQINSSATAMIVAGCVLNSDTYAYFSGATALLLDSDHSVVQYQPSPVQYGTFHFSFAGNLAVTANAGRVVVAREGVVKDLQALVKTAPVTTNIIFDVNTWDGANYTSMCSTYPEIAAAATLGGTQPDGTYARRCLRRCSGTTASAGSILTVDIDQVGTGTTGADGVLEVRVLQYASPLERFQSY